MIAEPVAGTAPPPVQTSADAASLRSAPPPSTNAPHAHRTTERWANQKCKLTEAEFGTLSTLKKRAERLARPMKRSEILRIGLQVLANLDDAALFDVLDRTTLVRR